MSNEELDALSKRIIIACIEVHRNMGPGLLEKVYEYCLLRELELMGIGAVGQHQVELQYKGSDIDKTFSIDILVEDEIVLELKAAEVMHPVFEAQVISYLKLSGKKLGFLINFNVPLMKQGIRRFVNGW